MTFGWKSFGEKQSLSLMAEAKQPGDAAPSPAPAALPFDMPEAAAAACVAYFAVALALTRLFPVLGG